MDNVNVNQQQQIIINALYKMKRRTITSFISSKYRGTTDKTYDLTVDYPDEGISCKDNEYIELNVVSFDMPNNMYNINSLNFCR